MQEVAQNKEFIYVSDGITFENGLIQTIFGLAISNETVKFLNPPKLTSENTLHYLKHAYSNAFVRNLLPPESLPWIWQKPFHLITFNQFFWSKFMFPFPPAVPFPKLCSVEYGRIVSCVNSCSWKQTTFSESVLTKESSSMEVLIPQIAFILSARLISLYLYVSKVAQLECPIFSSEQSVKCHSEDVSGLELILHLKKWLKILLDHYYLKFLFTH